MRVHKSQDLWVGILSYYTSILFIMVSFLWLLTHRFQNHSEFNYLLKRIRVIWCFLCSGCLLTQHSFALLVWMQHGLFGNKDQTYPVLSWTEVHWNEFRSSGKCFRTQRGSWRGSQEGILTPAPPSRPLCAGWSARVCRIVIMDFCVMKFYAFNFHFLQLRGFCHWCCYRRCGETQLHQWVLQNM